MRNFIRFVMIFSFFVGIPFAVINKNYHIVPVIIFNCCVLWALLPPKNFKS